MTVLSAQSIRRLDLLEPFREGYIDSQGRSAGLSAASYDVTIDGDLTVFPGEVKLASTREIFDMPNDLSAVVRDKSSLARKFLTMHNTHIDPGFKGHVTLEMKHNGNEPLFFKHGDAIAQVVFEMLDEPTEQPYSGRYQNQERGPQEAR